MAKINHIDDVGSSNLSLVHKEALRMLIARCRFLVNEEIPEWKGNCDCYETRDMEKASNEIEAILEDLGG